jgi:hypothetical protein
MKHVILAAFIALITLPATAPVAEAGRISRACIKAGRSSATPALCRCVQRQANRTLSFSDRRRAAKFFRKPQMAQDVRQSDSPKLEAFWKRYKAFGQAAKTRCGS